MFLDMRNNEVVYLFLLFSNHKLYPLDFQILFKYTIIVLEGGFKYKQEVIHS